MAVSEDFLAFIQDQLSALGDIESKRMFGGVGFFKEGLMFALIGKGTFRLKVDQQDRPAFEERGMTPPKKNGVPYWEVPADVLEDKDEMIKWASMSHAAAIRAKKK